MPPESIIPRYWSHIQYEDAMRENNIRSFGN